MSEINEHGCDPITLSPADAAAMDAILDPSEAPAADPARKQQAAAWLKVVHAASAPAVPADLMQRTLHAVQESDRMRLAERSNVPADEGARSYRPRWRRRLAEFGAMGIAAMLFITVVVAGLNQAKKSQIRVACVGNLKNLSMGFNTYAASNGGALPMIAIASNKNWLHGSSDGARTNAAHLTELIATAHVPMNAFYCPGSPPDPAAPKAATAVADIGTIGYSYRNMYGSDKPAWDGKKETIVMTDRNPLFADPTKKFNINANSENHDGHGNNVLHGDGAVTWATSPNIGPNHDNIWTIGSGNDRILAYKGTETPLSLIDVIVCP
ncbi:MAG TPA: hypothetical protein VHM90_16750 [Phycisphaerae bacterium]|nr:hypothetical protein [Phycisphaerae bacterium]